MPNDKPASNANKTTPTPASPDAAKPKKKLVLDINDVQSVLERKISP